ncbi:hypothetical protein EV686_10233 [Paracandidimonas soli]|uniref:Uncharacterized protein n=3 Tax=Paracandidimonas soli TaxID=1917182 RepID=A0A4R3VEX6_9BURK|nr:hypothetical protein EV686_10233 [Paracandidimonas soli]
MPIFRIARVIQSLRPLGAAGLAMGMALSMNSAYGQGKRLPPVADPDASALIGRAENDLARAIDAGPAFFDLSQGTLCPLDHGGITRATAGPLAYAKMAHLLEAEPPPEVSRMAVLSGACPQGGMFNGPVEYMTETKVRVVFDTIVVTTENKQRSAGVFIKGNPVGEHLTSRWTLTTSFNRLSSGELIEVKSGHPKLPFYSVYYQSLDSDSVPASPSVDFSWSGGSPIGAMTIVSRAIGSDRVVRDHYNDGKLATRARYKNHQQHGWIENFDPGVIKMGMGKLCFQNGQMIQAVECPDT